MNAEVNASKETANATPATSAKSAKATKRGAIKRHIYLARPVNFRKLYEKLGVSNCAIKLRMGTSTASRYYNADTIPENIELLAQMILEKSGESTPKDSILIIKVPSDKYETIKEVVVALGAVVAFRHQ